MKKQKNLVLVMTGLVLAGVVLVGGCVMKPDKDDEGSVEDGQQGAGWQTETVDDSGWVGIDPSIAVDSSSNPSISYYDEDNHDLKYAWRQDGSWQSEVVDSTGDVGEESSLVIDGQGTVHVSYVNHDKGALKYARKSGGSWDISTIDDDNSHHVVATSIVLDGQGYPHVAYNWEGGAEYNNGNNDEGDGKDVGNEGMDDDKDVDDKNNGVVDGNNNKNDNDSGFIKFASWNGSSWDIEEAAPGGSDVYLALDNKDQPHVCFIKGDPNTDPRIHYASQIAGSWQTEIVDSATKSGGDCGIDVDSSGGIHITYHDYGQGAIKYAKQEGDTWETQTVVTGTGKQEGLRMVVDSASQPHVIFVNDQTEKLIHAILTGDSWTQEIINKMGIPSVAIDGNDRLHVAHGYSVETDKLEDETEIMRYSTREY
ncbi:hypothetical protein KJ903_02180 [Patescibacteria group bacterium]|nr:hypothetical protein [Patescibacteria group bacterium]